MSPILGLDFGNVIRSNETKGLMDGVFDGIQRLSKEMFDDRVYVISRINYDTNEEREAKIVKWNAHLLDWNLNQFIPPGRMFVCRYRADKADIAWRLGMTHFVDDRTEVLFRMKGVVDNLYAFNPTEDQLKTHPPDGMTVVTSWDEIVQTILASTV